MKRSIDSAVLVGLGALGILYGQKMLELLGPDHFAVVMDEAHYQKHVNEVYRVNGEAVPFPLITPDEIAGPADLAVIATKAGGLAAAREMIRNAVGPETTVISLINGIHSEEYLAEVYPREQILDTIVLGTDSFRTGTEITYTHGGRWQTGATSPAQEEHLSRLAAFLGKAGIACEVCPYIRRTVWNKFMVNIGINQTCMVYNTTYGGATAEGPVLEDMKAAMREVMKIAAAEGISLTEEDLEQDLGVLRGLDPDGCPSMQQDALAHRPSEVDIFAGTMLRLSKKHGIPVPVNERYYRIVKEMEAGY